MLKNTSNYTSYQKERLKNFSLLWHFVNYTCILFYICYIQILQRNLNLLMVFDFAFDNLQFPCTSCKYCPLLNIGWLGSIYWFQFPGVAIFADWLNGCLPEHQKFLRKFIDSLALNIMCKKRHTCWNICWL